MNPVRLRLVETVADGLCRSSEGYGVNPGKTENARSYVNSIIGVWEYLHHVGNYASHLYWGRNHPRGWCVHIDGAHSQNESNVHAKAASALTSGHRQIGLEGEIVPRVILQVAKKSSMPMIPEKATNHPQVKLERLSISLVYFESRSTILHVMPKLRFTPTRYLNRGRFLLKGLNDVREQMFRWFSKR